MSTTLSTHTSSSSCRLAEVPTPPSPLSETASSHLPQSPSTGIIWAELATLTVSAFTEPIVSRLRAFIDQTPQFDKSHLQMLGPIVIRHIALMLEDTSSAPPQPPVCHCRRERRRPRSARIVPSSPRSQEENIGPKPTTPSSSGPPRRPSLRDIAYQAVRLKKILPESFSAQPHPDVPSKIVRKLSITTRTPEPGRTPFLTPDLPTPVSGKHPAPPPLILRRHSCVHMYEPDNSKPNLSSCAEKEPLRQTSDLSSKDLSTAQTCSESYSSINPTSKSRDPGSDSDDRSASFTDFKVSTRWRLQQGRPDPAYSMPRAGLHTNLENYSACLLKSQPCIESRHDSDPPSSHDTSPQGHVPPPCHYTVKDKSSNPTQSRLVLLRRQRERKRSSLR